MNGLYVRRINVLVQLAPVLLQSFRRKTGDMVNISSYILTARVLLFKYHKSIIHSVGNHIKNLILTDNLPVQTTQNILKKQQPGDHQHHNENRPSHCGNQRIGRCLVVALLPLFRKIKGYIHLLLKLAEQAGQVVCLKSCDFGRLFFREPCQLLKRSHFCLNSVKGILHPDNIFLGPKVTVFYHV